MQCRPHGIFLLEPGKKRLAPVFTCPPTITPMATLVDHQIEELCKLGDLIYPFNLEQLNPASYDVRLGNNILLEQPDGSLQRTSTPHIMKPGEFVLANLYEAVNLPDNLEAQIQLKSSRAREGYNHSLSGYVDPGYYGILTLELSNINRYRALNLVEGMLIAQLRFMVTADTVRRSYSETGHYNGDRRATSSRVDIFGKTIEGI